MSKIANIGCRIWQAVSHASVVAWIWPAFLGAPAALMLAAQSIPLSLFGGLIVAICGAIIALCIAWLTRRLFRWILLLNRGYGATVNNATAAVRRQLTYLTNRDSELGPAIERMAHKSALGQWYAAQILVTSGIPIDEVSRLNFAASKVRDKILDGALEIRGGIHNQYNAIPRTEWRTAILGFFPDRMALWKMRVTPGGMVTMESDGSVHTDVDQDTIAHLLQFDSLLVDSYQFEDLWPRVESVADKERRQFLKEARKRHLDQDTIKDLS